MSALRQIWRHPWHSLTCVALLALGLGANTAISSVLYPAVLKRLPYHEPERLAAIHNRFPQLNNPRLGTSPLDYLDLRSHGELFVDAGVYYHLDLTRTGIERPVKVNAIEITSSLFRTLGAAPLLGRTFTALEESFRGPHAVLLSEGYWRSAFGADPQILTRALQLNGELYPVVGVMPNWFRFPGDATEMWVPLSFQPRDLAPSARTNEYLRMYARLAPGVDYQRASARLEELSRQSSLENPDGRRSWSLGWRWFLLPLARDDDGSTRRWAAILFAAVTCLMLIVCSNVAGLLLLRSAERRFELSVRMALGASRLQAARQVMIEVLLLAVAGGIAGLLLAQAGVHLLATYGPLPKPQMEAPVLWFGAALSLIAGLACGVYPAWAATNVAAIEALRDGGRQRTASPGKRGWQRGLTVVQVGIATTLLVCGGVLAKSLVRLLDVPPGFDPHDVLTLQISLPGLRYSTPESRARFYDRVLGETARIPGVEAAAACTLLPFGYGDNINSFDIAGQPKAAVPSFANLNEVLPGYFEALKIPLLRGRYLTPRDLPGSEPVVVIDETLARTYFPAADPIGQRIRLPWGATFTVAGVVGAVKTSGLDVDGRQTLYFSAQQSPRTDLSVVIRSRLPPNTIADRVRNIVARIDKDQPIYDVAPLETLVDRSLKTRRFVVALVAGFAAAGTGLAALGLFGLLSYTVALRRSEIGIRMALGADGKRIALWTCREGVALVAAGMALGCAGALAAQRLLASQLYGTGFSDGSTWLAVLTIIGFTGFLACAIPAWRAARQNPIQALRSP